MEDNTFGQIRNTVSNAGSGFVNTVRTSNKFLIALVGIVLLIVLIIIIVVLVSKAKKRSANVTKLISSPLDAYDIKNNSFQVTNSDQVTHYQYQLYHRRSVL